jgi:hypothetical protein
LKKADLVSNFGMLLRLRLHELMDGTDSFELKNIIGVGAKVNILADIFTRQCLESQ